VGLPPRRAFGRLHLRARTLFFSNSFAACRAQKQLEEVSPSQTVSPTGKNEPTPEEMAAIKQAEGDRPTARKQLAIHLQRVPLALHYANAFTCALGILLCEI
jgi:hypothetical protein